MSGVKAGFMITNQQFEGVDMVSALEEQIARIAGWAIFGTAIQWSQEPMTVSSAEMAQTILLVIMDGVARLGPEAVPA